MYNMKRYLRKVTKRSNTKFEYTLSIPAFFIRKLGLDDNIVELKIKDDSMVIKKIGEKLENTSYDKPEDSKYVSIHY